MSGEVEPEYSDASLLRAVGVIIDDTGSTRGGGVGVGSEDSLCVSYHLSNNNHPVDI